MLATSRGIHAQIQDTRAHRVHTPTPSHLRRYNRDYAKTTEAQIDLYFGWQERILKKAMQVHYESMSIRARMALAKITGWM